MEVAALVHNASWHATEDRAIIAPGIALCRASGSKPWALYEQLCCNLGLDGGEPFQFDAYIQFSDEDGPVDFGEAFSEVDRFCNILAVVGAEPPGLCRVIHSDDGFRNHWGTLTIFRYGAQTDFLSDGSIAIADDLLEETRTCWNTEMSLWREGKSRGRITNALSYFYYAWRAPYADQMCLNLATALDVLFASHWQSTTDGQRAYCVARFVGGSADKRRDICELTKKLYAARSCAMRGDTSESEDIVRKGFLLVAAVLKRLLQSRSEAERFEDENTRKELLQEYLSDS